MRGHEHIKGRGGMKTKSKKDSSNNPAQEVRRIVVAVDFSEQSRQAMQQAIQLAGTYGASLSLVHVVEPAPFFSGAHTDPLMVMPDKKMAMLAQTKLDDLAAAEIPEDIEVETKVAIGRSHKEIVAHAKRWGADLIVIGTHGYTGLKHTFLGSTAEAVVRHAHCPVFVTRPRRK